MAEVVEGMSGETVKKRVPNPTGKGGFKPGQPGGPGRGKKKPKPPAGIDVLADMDKAYSTAETPSDSPMVKAFRKKAHDEPEKFLAQYIKLKLAATENGAGQESEEPEAEFGSVGPKEVAVEELAEQLLAEWEKESATGQLNV